MLHSIEKSKFKVGPDLKESLINVKYNSLPKYAECKNDSHCKNFGLDSDQTTK